jgi:hypothetical protein
VQAFIFRVTLPSAFDELAEQVRNDGLDTGSAFGMSDIERLAETETVHWSAPKHAMSGDVVLFQVSANARPRARRMRPMLDAMLDDGAWMGMDAAVGYGDQYAGSIIAIGRIDGAIRSGKAISAHVKSRSFAPVTDLTPVIPPFSVVGHPVWSEWPEFQPQGPVQYRQFASDQRYQHFMAELETTLRRPLPSWTRAAPVTTGSGNVSKSTWMQLARKADAGYAHEVGVHQMYADWLLRDLSDQRRLYDEVDAYTGTKSHGRVDNVILVSRVPVPVEVKIRASALPDLFEQLNRYSTAETLRKGDKTFPERIHDIVLVVDQDGIYITDESTRTLPAPAIARIDTTKRRIDSLRYELKQRIRMSSREGT